MKKFLTIASAVAVTTAAALAIEWNEGVENLAQGATVVASSERANPDEAPSKITDGNLGTGWQAVAKANAVSADWIIVDLGESKTFTDIEITWEASHMKKSLTANGTAVSGSAKFTVKYEWTKENIAEGKAINGRMKTVIGEDETVVENPNGFANATDGDEETYY